MAGAAATGKQGGKSGTIATLAILTVLAGGGGALVGKLVGARLRAPSSAPATTATSPSPYVGTTEVRELQPVVTDLVGTPPTRVRLQAAIVYAKAGVDNPALLTAQVSDDILAFLKTLSLAQLEGASGLQNLREDLNERAVVRSQGHVREVIIETLVTQ